MWVTFPGSDSMSMRITTVFMLALLLAGCDGNPFLPEEGPVEPDPDLPPELPGTNNPTASGAITRYEAREEATGNGYAENITFDASSNTFSVDNLGFDGANLYQRGTAVASLGPYEVYEASSVVNDPLTGRPIPQFQHRLIAGRGTETEFAIVRTGAYQNYGFGGFVMRRDTTGVNLPTTGQAGYSGDYAGLQDFNGSGGLRYTTGDAFVAIDFEDFNNGDAVRGRIDNRRIYDLAGADITASVIDAINDAFSPDAGDPLVTELPTLLFRVGPGAIDPAGEIRGTLGNTLVDWSGQGGRVIEYEVGNYYAIVAGANAEEVVGIIVVESAFPGIDGLTQRETGGFVLYR